MSYVERCHPCGRTVSVDPANMQINRWVGAGRFSEWQLVGFCPLCGAQVLSHTFRHPGSARELIDAGAAVAVFDRDGELDDPQRRRRIRLLDDDEIEMVLVDALELMRDEPRFRRAVGMLVDRYGSRGGGL